MTRISVLEARVCMRRAHLKRVHIVRHDDDLVPALLVILDEELARLELARIHAVQQPALPRRLLEVLAIKLWGHRAPHFCALIHVRKREIHVLNGA